MALMVRCKNCGFEHPSGVQKHEVSFKTAIISNNSETCPQCGRVSTYGKQDYFFK